MGTYSQRSIITQCVGVEENFSPFRRVNSVTLNRVVNSLWSQSLIVRIVPVLPLSEWDPVSFIVIRLCETKKNTSAILKTRTLELRPVPVSSGMCKCRNVIVTKSVLSSNKGLV